MDFASNNNNNNNKNNNGSDMNNDTINNRKKKRKRKQEQVFISGLPVLQTGARGDEFRRMKFQLLREEYRKLSGLECKSKNREWIVGKCVQMRTYGKQEAIGKRTIRAALNGLRRNKDGTQKTREEIQSDFADIGYGYDDDFDDDDSDDDFDDDFDFDDDDDNRGVFDNDDNNHNHRMKRKKKVIKMFTRIDEYDIENARRKSDHPLLKNEVWTCARLPEILESFLDEGFTFTEHRIVLMRISQGMATIDKKKDLSIETVSFVLDFALRMATKCINNNNIKLSGLYHRLLIVVCALALLEETSTTTKKEEHKVEKEEQEEEEEELNKMKKNVAEFLPTCIHKELARSPSLAKYLMKRPEGFRDSFYDERDKIWPSISFAICTSEEVSKEICDKAWVQLQKNARCLKEEDFFALAYTLGKGINNVDDTATILRKKRYFVNDCIRNVQRKGSEEVCTSFIRAIFQLWREFRKEILEVLCSECAKIFEDNFVFVINYDEDKSCKIVWLNVLEAVSDSCELTKDEVDANRSILLQLLSRFNASRDFENPIAKRVVFALNRLFIKSNFFEGKKEAKRLMKEIPAHINNNSDLVSTLDGDGGLGGDDKFKPNLIDDADKLCSSLKSIAPLNDIEALSSSSLIATCGKLAFESLQKYWPGFDFKREGLDSSSNDTTIDEVKMAFKLLRASIEASYNTATACDTSAQKMNHLSSFMKDSMNPKIIAQGAREACQTLFIAQRDPRVEIYSSEKMDQKKLKLIENAANYYPVGSLLATLSHGIYHQIKRYELHELNIEWGIDKEWFAVLPEIVRLMEFLFPLAMQESSDMWAYEIVRTAVILNDRTFTKHMKDIGHRSVSSMITMMLKFERLEFGASECILTASEMLSMIGSSTSIERNDVASKISLLKIFVETLASELPLLPSWEELASTSTIQNNKICNRISVIDAIVDSASALGETVEIFIPLVVDEWKKSKADDEENNNHRHDHSISSSMTIWLQIQKDIATLADSLFMASKYCLEACQRAASFLTTHSEKKKGEHRDLAAIVLSGARLHYATGGVLEYFQEELDEDILIGNIETLELSRRAFIAQCAATVANLKALKKMKLLDRSLLPLVYALKVDKNYAFVNNDDDDSDDEQQQQQQQQQQVVVVEGDEIQNVRKRKFGLSIYATAQTKDLQQQHVEQDDDDDDTTTTKKDVLVVADVEKDDVDDDVNDDQSEQPKKLRKKSSKKRITKKRRNRCNNPYLQAVREHEGGKYSDDDDDDDLADFIVCKPGRDYRQVFGLNN
jgi:hypothetical protein